VIREILGYAAAVLVLVFILIAGLMGLTEWHKGVRAENDKKQCIEAGYTPVPSYGRYYCKSW
jgi:hypothetical protein